VAGDAENSRPIAGNIGRYMSVDSAPSPTMQVSNAETISESGAARTIMTRSVAFSIAVICSPKGVLLAVVGLGPQAFELDRTVM
jgi:hypothetical protein